MAALLVGVLDTIVLFDIAKSLMASSQSLPFSQALIAASKVGASATILPCNSKPKNYNAFFDSPLFSLALIAVFTVTALAFITHCTIALNPIQPFSPLHKHLSQHDKMPLART